jgi:ribonuclease-3
MLIPGGTCSSNIRPAVMDVMAADLDRLEAVLKHRFADRTILSEALTHASAVSDGLAETTYQRLEFLGDRVLGIVVADMLYDHFADAEEGELSRRLTKLVRGETCAEIAARLDLGAFALLGQGERQGGGRNNRAILANLCESVIGALYRDGGEAAARQFIEEHWRPLMLSHTGPLRDAKTALQEWAHQRGNALPVYREMERSGPDHAPQFTVEVHVDGVTAATGHGASKRAAEQEAAAGLLVAQGVWENKP